MAFFVAKGTVRAVEGQGRVNVDVLLECELFLCS